MGQDHTQASNVVIIKNEIGADNLLKWPANSPDLNPIENLWSIMQQKIDARKPQPYSTQQLLEAVQYEWDNINPDVIKKLVMSFATRLQKCVELDGEATIY